MLLHGPPGEALNTLRRPRRGLKIHAVLQYYVCTSGQHLPHSKGGNAVRFAGRRGHVPVITAFSPFKRGKCCPFCWPPGARTRYHSIFPIQKGEMLSVLLAAGGMYPLQQHLPPSKGGDAVRFFAGRRGHVPAQIQHLPHAKGGDAVCFYAPPPREVQCFFVFLSPLGPL